MGTLKDYKEALNREFKSRQVLRTAARDIAEGEAKEGKYSIRAMLARESARRVLDDPNNGLGVSEEIELGDAVRNASRDAAYLASR